MGSEDQFLIVQSKKSRTNYHKDKRSHQKKNTRKSNKYLYKYICYTCDERGHLARAWKLNPGVRTITFTKIANYTCKLHTKETEYGAEH